MTTKIMVAFSSQLFGDVSLSEHIHARKLTNRCPKLISLPPREVYSSQVSITILASWNAFGREVLCRDCEIRCGHGQKDKPASFKSQMLHVWNICLKNGPFNGKWLSKNFHPMEHLAMDVCCNDHVFHQPRFPWNKGSHFPSKKLPFGVKTPVFGRYNLTWFMESSSTCWILQQKNHWFTVGFPWRFKKPGSLH